MRETYGHLAWVSQGSSEDECSNIRVRDGPLEGRVGLDVVVVQDMRRLERFDVLDVVMMVGERHFERALRSY